MIETPRFVPARQDFIIPLTPTPNYYPELPYHLRKYVLKKIRDEEGSAPESLWNERGVWIERRVQSLFAKLAKIKNVALHEHGSEEDAAGHDLTVQLEDGLTVHIQVKSSEFGIIKFKKAIRNNYFPGELNNESQVDKWMTENGIILINGSETRSDTEILNHSFYPQLEAIRQRHRSLAITPIIDIGQLAFSGSANPDDAVRWIAQNPQ